MEEGTGSRSSWRVVATDLSCLRVMIMMVSQWSNLRHLGESLWGAEGLLEAMSFKKVTKGMGRGSVANARWE